MASQLLKGSSPFRRHHRVLNWLGYSAGIGVYLLGYGLVASVFQSGGMVQIVVAATLAAVSAGLSLGWLYGRAIGSPYGNVLLAAVIPAHVPWVVYTAPFPGTSLPGGTWSHPEIVLPAVVAGVCAAVWTVDRTYARKDDPAAWERAVMPRGFRVADGKYLTGQPSTGDGRTTTTPRLNPRTEAQYRARINIGRWLASLVVVAPTVAVALYGQMTYDDDAFTAIMMFAMLVMLHWSLRLERVE